VDFSLEADNVTYPTLSLTCFEEEDEDYALVKKIGAKDSSANVFTSAFPSDEPESLATAISTAPEKSRCVFHVAQHMTTSMPVGTESLEIRERGSTKIFLTSGSDEIEAHSLISELRYSKRPVRRNNRRTVEMATEQGQEQEQFGPGWFTWRTWRVDQSLIQEFSTLIGQQNKYRTVWMAFKIN
jgi:hypothetical protein